VRGWLFGSIGMLLGLMAGFAVWGGRSEASDPPTTSPAAKLTPVAAPVAGALAPDFEANGAEGDPFRMSESRGQVVVLNFWATWCEPCREEMPLLQARYHGKGSSAGLLVVGINTGDTQAEVRAYGDTLDLTFPLVLAPGREIEALYRIRGYPTTFFIDEAGVIQHVHVGSMDSETLDGYLRSMGLN